MSYSKYFASQEVRIPVPISIGVIILIMLFLTKVFSTSPVPSRASLKKVQNLQIVNPSTSQVGLFWQTSKKEIGWIVYGQSQTNLDQIEIDERDLQNKRMPYYRHFVMLKNLKPNAVYYYKVVSDNQLVTDNVGKAFTFTTPSDLSLNSTLNPAYGKIIKSNGEGLENAIVLLTFNSSYPLLTLTKTTGEWLVPLHTVVNKDSLKTQSLNLTDKIKIEVYSGDNIKSEIQTDVANVSPLPQTVIIGQDYTITNSESVLSATSKKIIKPLGKIDILFPKEGASIPGGQPIIKGTGIVGNDIAVNINDKNKLALHSVVDKDGLWQINLKENLTSGNYQLTMTTKNEAGKSIQIVRKFTIIKSGEQVLGDATSEATPTIGTPTETIIPSPTVYYSPYPTQPLETSTPSPPTSGIDVIPLAAASASLIVVGIGNLLAF